MLKTEIYFPFRETCNEKFGNLKFVSYQEFNSEFPHLVAFVQLCISLLENGRRTNFLNADVLVFFESSHQLCVIFGQMSLS